jgi:hypothetical protein
MRILNIVALCAVLGGCGAARQEVTARPELIGQNLDTLIARFGQPTSSSKIDNDQNSYVWQLSAAAEPAGRRPRTSPYGGLYGDGDSPGNVNQGFSPLCTIKVTTSPAGTVTQASTEESNGTGAGVGLLGAGGGICAQRLGGKSPT